MAARRIRHSNGGRWRGFTARRWTGLAAGATVLQGTSCIFDLETALETGLLTVANSFTSSIVQALLSDLLGVEFSSLFF